MAKSKGEEDFIEQKTRELLVRWADYCIKSGGPLPDFEGDLANQAADDLGMHKDYWDLALSRGWLTKKTPRTLTSTGWGVAAAFLKR